jgi:hypothetical protein
MFQLSAAQVQGLAPDAASAAAGKKLAKPASWRNLGYSADALWGECQGSALYQTRVSLADLTAKCSCPSRKFPCKHSLGLLLLAVDTPNLFAAGAPPEWVTSWLEKRDASQQKKQERVAQAAAKPVDEVAQGKRLQKRHDSIAAGLDQLDAWLADLLRGGLARARAEPPSFWDTQARRLVDAQAPGLATRLRQCSARLGAGEESAARLLDDLGGLALLTHAYRRLDALEPALADDVRRMLGITLDQAEVIAHGDLVEDDWSVLGVVVEDDERVRMQRVWLEGARSGRRALVLQFAVGGARFTEALVLGSTITARLAFWPSACPQRALIAERSGVTGAMERAPRGETIAVASARFADRLARLPWLEREVFVLDSVVLVPEPRACVVDAEARALGLVGEHHDLLLAWSGGHPVTLVAEWDGYALAPLAAWSTSRVLALAGTVA